MGTLAGVIVARLRLLADVLWPAAPESAPAAIYYIEAVIEEES